MTKPSETRIKPDLLSLLCIVLYIQLKRTICMYFLLVELTHGIVKLFKRIHKIIIFLKKYIKNKNNTFKTFYCSHTGMSSAVTEVKSVNKEVTNSLY